MNPNAPQSAPKPSLKTTPKAPCPSTSPSDARVVSQLQNSERLLKYPSSHPDHNNAQDAPCPAVNVCNTPRVDTLLAPLLASAPIITSPN